MIERRARTYVACGSRGRNRTDVAGSMSPGGAPALSLLYERTEATCIGLTPAAAVLRYNRLRTRTASRDQIEMPSVQGEGLHAFRKALPFACGADQRLQAGQTVFMRDSSSRFLTLNRRREAPTGFEPVSPQIVAALCQLSYKAIWSWQKDSNPQPAAYEAAALPLSYTSLYKGRHCPPLRSAGKRKEERLPRSLRHNFTRTGILQSRPRQ